VGIIELVKLLGCPEKHMELHFWYLKRKSWIERTDTGGFAITAEEVDSTIEQDILLRKDRLLPPGRECSNEYKDSEGETINYLVGTPQFGIDAA
jgi:curved DNA-binding protein